jgi:nicotinate-nucleotide--dimethylbenzimidazole phosphoribosyltransferase
MNSGAMNSEAWRALSVGAIDERVMERARARNAELTKPAGSLGRLETIAIRLAGMQRRERPSADRVRIVIFAADHGVANEGVSAFPQSVTVEMVRNFARGGAAINVLARSLGAELEVVDVGTAHDPGALPDVISQRISGGTANFVRGEAMSREQFVAGLNAGRAAVERAVAAGAEIIIGGEMGIANTTSAAAIVCALLGADPEGIAGPGTGLDRNGLERKISVLRRALSFHANGLDDPYSVVQRLGGFEIAALMGTYLACAHRGVPAIIDGFISSAAALAAARAHPQARQWFLFAHASAEPGHRRILEALDVEPLLNLGLRLGEGSGAAAAVPLLRLACTLHNEMATFAEAAVSKS